VSQYQKGKTNLDFTEARGSEWQWHQLGHMQVCTSLQTDNHANPSNFATGYFTGYCGKLMQTSSVNVGERARGVGRGMGETGVDQ